MLNNRYQELRKILPAKPDIVGRGDYLSSAILVPLVLIDGEEQLLFEKRSPHIKQGSEICFPGGHFDAEKDLSYQGTALREVREELGLEPDSIRVAGQLDTLVSPRGLIVECFLAIVDLPEVKDLRLDPEEVVEVFTVPISWFQNNPPEIYRTRVEMQSSYIDNDGNEQILLPVEELWTAAAIQRKQERVVSTRGCISQGARYNMGVDGCSCS